MTANYAYMDSSELVALLDDSERRKKVVIIDCRDDDRDRGYISRSMHFPSLSQTKERIDDLVTSLTMNNISIAVFHCAFSEVRGPKSANRFAASLREKELSTPLVYVLRGGWEQFFSHYGKSRGDLICC